MKIYLDSRRCQDSGVVSTKPSMINNRCTGTALAKVAVCALVAILASGCAVKGSVDQEQVAEKLDAYVVEDGTITHDVDDEQVARLWQEAEILRRSGDIENAQSRLQQAIEITPNDAVLWSRAAELELEQNSHLRAENYAAKSNFLASAGNTPLRYRNWLIIQMSREGRGDLLGAREAEIESTRLNP